MNTNDMWRGFPDDLKKLFIAFKNRGTTQAFEDLLNYLLHRREVNQMTESEDKIDYLMFVDRLFCDLMYPLEYCTELWKQYSIQLKGLLEFSKDLMDTLDGDKTLSERPRTENGACSERDLTILSQRQQIYFCTLYEILNNYDEYLLCLKKIEKTTERNINYLLAAPTVDELIKMDVTLKDLNIMGSEYFEEPLAFVVAELANNVCDLSFAEALLKEYENYYTFLLNKRECRGAASDVLDDLRSRAERRLSSLGKVMISCLDDLISSKAEEIRECIAEKAAIEEKYIY